MSSKVKIRLSKEKDKQGKTKKITVSIIRDGIIEKRSFNDEAPAFKCIEEIKATENLKEKNKN